MLRIRDVYAGSRIRIFPSRSRVKNIPDPHRRIKLFLTPKLFLSSRKYDPGSGSWFFYLSRILDPGVKKAPDPGSRGQKGTGSRIRNTTSGWVHMSKPLSLVENDILNHWTPSPPLCKVFFFAFPQTALESFLNLAEIPPSFCIQSSIFMILQFLQMSYTMNWYVALQFSFL